MNNNMFDKNHYVPILKWKRAEQKALEFVENKNPITPLIEIVMPNFKGDRKRITEDLEGVTNELISIFETERVPMIPKEVLKYWGKNPIFIDLSLLYTNTLKAQSFKKILSAGAEIDLRLIPVLNLNDEIEIKEVVCEFFKKNKNGLCLRLVPADFVNIEELNKKIENFLAEYDLSQKDIDLLVDLKEIEDDSGKYEKYVEEIHKTNDLDKWRNFIFGSGAFPKNLVKCRLEEPALLPRHDWIGWTKCIKNNKFKRIPTHADYTIRYPIYDESLQFHFPTTSIKYTFKEIWYILKGKKQEYGIYLANANLLMGDTDHFYGENFSYGDKCIVEKGKYYEKYVLDPSKKGTGSSEYWIMVGINHHLACTVDQIANLSWRTSIV